MSSLDQMFSLNGLLAVVAGGSSGIGREIALGFRAAGARVVVVGRDQEKLDRVEQELGGIAPHAGNCVYSADMRSVAAIRGLEARIADEWGPVDVLVNCQGTTVIKPALEVREEEYDLILDTNLKSLFFACTVFGRGMVERKSGSIINIASLAAHHGWAMAAAYSCSKFGVQGLTKSLAGEWGEASVRVNAISPGFFLTDMNRDKMPAQRKAEAAKRSAMRRMGELPELVGAAVYLASPAARFVTGTTLQVDGGYLSSGI